MNPQIHISKTYPVTGMSCASCAARTETLVKSLPGISRASVNFADTSLYVDFNPHSITASEIKKAVQSIGYDLIIDETGADKKKDEAFNDHLRSIRIQHNIIGYSDYPGCYYRHVLYGYSICQLHYACNGHSCSFLVWKAVPGKMP